MNMLKNCGHVCYLYNSMLLLFNLLIWQKDAESINCKIEDTIHKP